MKYSGSNVSRLQTLRSFFYYVVYGLSFIQGLETRALDCIEMYEYIVAAIIL